MTTGTVSTDHAVRYIAPIPVCRACPFKPKCCPNMPARRVLRDVNEDARDVARSLAKTDAFEQSRRDRKRVEMLFAHLKRILRLGRLDRRSGDQNAAYVSSCAVPRFLGGCRHLFSPWRSMNLAKASSCCLMKLRVASSFNWPVFSSILEAQLPMKISGLLSVNASRNTIARRKSY